MSYTKAINSSSSKASAVDGKPVIAAGVSKKPSVGPTRSDSTAIPASRTVSRNESGEPQEVCEGCMSVSSVIECPGDVMCVRFNYNGGLLAVGLNDGQIKIYNMESGKMAYSLSDDEIKTNKLPVTCLKFSPVQQGESPERSCKLLASYASGHVRLWHYKSGRCLHTINELRSSGQTLALTYSPLANQFVTVGADPQIFLYDVNTRQRINTLEATDTRNKMDGHRCRVFAVQYAPTEPHVFLTGGWDDTVQYWDDRERHSFRKFFGPHICGDALDIDPNSGQILTGSWRKECTLQIWDFGSGEKLKDVPDDPPYSSMLYSAQWLGKDLAICGGNAKNMAKIIDRTTLNTLGQLDSLPQGVYSIDNDRQQLGSAAPSCSCIAVAAGHKVYLLQLNANTGS